MSSIPQRGYFSAEFRLQTSLSRLVSKDADRPILITGPAGIGKTALATHIWNLLTHHQRSPEVIECRHIANRMGLARVLRKKQADHVILEDVDLLCCDTLEFVRKLRGIRIIATADEGFDGDGRFVHTVHLPSLRGRKNDIVPIAESILKREGPYTLEQGAQQILRSYNWPGEVAELRHCLLRSIQRAQISDRAVLCEADIENAIASASSKMECLDFFCAAIRQDLFQSSKKIGFKLAIHTLEAAIIRQSMNEAAGNLSVAARLLQLPVTTLESRYKTLKPHIDALSGPSRSDDQSFGRQVSLEYGAPGFR